MTRDSQKHSLADGKDAPILEVRDLHVYYGHAHALQGVTLALPRGVLAVVGRNGMGKTTLCNGIMSLVPVASGSIRVAGTELTGLAPNRIVEIGVGYVPQGRRVWPSLSVDEHLRVASRPGHGGTWTVERIYQTFAQLAERKRQGGAELSGGEQQMLAIGRALVANPRLLVMDEPTEGLAPVIVEQVAPMLKRLADEGQIAVLLVEQNLGVATEVADDVAVMVNGQIARTMRAGELAADHDLQQRLLGVRQRGDEEERPVLAPEPAPEPVRIYQVLRHEAEPASPPVIIDGGYSASRAPTRWSHADARTEPEAASADRIGGEPSDGRRTETDAVDTTAADIARLPVAATAGRVAYIAGTFDTKGRELSFIKQCLDRLGLRTVTVDLSTSERPSAATVGHRKSRATIPKAPAPSSRGTGAPPSPPWRRPSSDSS